MRPYIVFSAITGALIMCTVTGTLLAALPGAYIGIMVLWGCSEARGAVAKFSDTKVGETEQNPKNPLSAYREGQCWEYEGRETDSMSRVYILEENSVGIYGEMRFEIAATNLKVPYSPDPEVLVLTVSRESLDLSCLRLICTNRNFPEDVARAWSVSPPPKPDHNTPYWSSPIKSIIQNVDDYLSP